MLRLILSVTGVSFIALGILGGSPLDDLYQRLTAQTPRIVQADAVEGQLSSIQLQQADVSVDSAMQAPTAASELAQAAELPSGVVLAVNATAPEAVLPNATVLTDTSTVDTLVAEEISEVSSSVAQNLSPIAAGNAVDSATALKKVGAASLQSDELKSNDRNQQVAIAKNVVASVERPVSVEIDKKVEVGQTLQAAAGQVENSMLIVIKDKVNMRDGPSIEHPIVLQLEEGQELMEFKREGNWVHVGAYGTSGKIGWVHQRLVGAN